MRGGGEECRLRGNGATQSATCCTMCKSVSVGIGHERFLIHYSHLLVHFILRRLVSNIKIILLKHNRAGVLLCCVFRCRDSVWYCTGQSPREGKNRTFLLRFCFLSNIFLVTVPLELDVDTNHSIFIYFLLLFLLNEIFIIQFHVNFKT